MTASVPATAHQPPLGCTPTNTATRGPSATVTATVTATPSGGATPTATILATPTATPTITPIVGNTPTATVTPTQGGGGLSWRLDGATVTQVSVPSGGMGYAPGMLSLVDSQNRFCEEATLRPTLRVEVGNRPIVGVFDMNTKGNVGIANIPALPDGTQPETYDLSVETRLTCMAGDQLTKILFSNAIKYEP